MKFDFDTPVNRRGTDSVKWDECRCDNELPLWVADMDFHVAPAIVDALVRRAQHGVFGYTFPGDDYFEAVNRWFTTRHDWSIPRDHILYTTGVVPATSAVIKGLTQPGDGVVIMTPVYTCFFSSIRNNDCQVVSSPLLMENGLYRIDFDDLEQKLSQPRSRIMLLCNPHNPGGRVWTADELARVDELCSRHGVTVLSDEIHCEIVMPGYRYTPFAKVATAKWVSMVSASKSFNTAGLHIANIVCSDPDMRASINRALNINETCDVGPFGIEATKAAYNHGLSWLEAMIDYVKQNYIFLSEELAGIPGIAVMPLEGSYLAWIDISTLGIKAAELTEQLRTEANVWFTPGTAYGEDGEGFIRINMATSRATLAEALGRFKTYLGTLNA